MLIVEMGKIESTGGHIKIMLFIEMATIEINRRLYWIMLIVEMGKIESTGGHIEFMLIIEMAKIESTAAILNLCEL